MSTAFLFHRSNALYEPSDRILAGNWGRLIQGIGPTHQHFYREYLWERIRELEFPALPSRMRAAFAFEDGGFADQFVQNPTIPTYTYLVRIPDPKAAVHRADMTWLDPDLINQYRTFQGVEQCARHYWAGDDRAGTAWEWLIAGELEIMQRLTPIMTNGASTG